MYKDIIESQRIRKLIRSRAKQCYANAARAIMALDEYADSDYIEGLAIIARGAVIEHGWIERDGVIVDPTLPDRPSDYFPGLRFRGRRGVADALKIPNPEGTSKGLPIFYRFGWGGIDSPEFRAALVCAYRFAGLEGLAQRYENYDPSCSTEVVII